MLMYGRNDLVALFNVMASFLAIISESRYTQEQLYISLEREALDKEYSTRMDLLFAKTPGGFLRGLKKLLKETTRETTERRACIAYVVCLWLDKHYTYDFNEGKISLYPLVPLGSGKPEVVGPLNNNFRKTKISINPIFCINRKITNRAAWKGINCDLINVAYYEWDGTKTVKNIILPETDLNSKFGKLVVAYAPLTADNTLLDADVFDGYVNEGMRCKGANLKLKADLSLLGKRIYADLISASKYGADVLFMPEMMGTEELCGKNREVIDFIKQASLKAAEEGVKLPAIIVLPSYWNNGSNSATIVSSVGRVLGVQEKYVPFVYFKGRWTEALKERKTKEMLIIHVPYRESLSIIICSEYLKDFTHNWSDVLCHSLGVNHIIVPSYSFGEAAFIKMLTQLNVTGSSVSWGNCCAANESKVKILGGRSIAECDTVEYYKICKCNKAECKAKSCVFVENVNSDEHLSEDKKQGIGIKHIVNEVEINEDEEGGLSEE